MVRFLEEALKNFDDTRTLADVSIPSMWMKSFRVIDDLIPFVYLSVAVPVMRKDKRRRLMRGRIRQPFLRSTIKDKVCCKRREEENFMMGEAAAGGTKKIGRFQ